MNEKILIKKLGTNIEQELESIYFSREYIGHASKKLSAVSIKIFHLKSAEANILKQTCLSLGFDAAVHRDAVTCKCDYSNAIILATKLQYQNLTEKLKKQPFRLKLLANIIEEQIITKTKDYIIKDKHFDFSKSYIMGIINVTPDSFSDGGKNFQTDTAVSNALKMLENGASIIDIGGESTRPGAIKISSEQECERVLPVIKKIREKNKEIILSIDTFHPETALASINAGVDILNNVGDPKIFEPIFDFLAEKNTPVVIMHSEEVPPKPEEHDYDGDIIEKIFMFFDEKIQYLKDNGLKNNLFILDPGIGFGKSIHDQYELIKRADEFLSLKYPVLYGISRKSFITKTFPEQNSDEITGIYSQYLLMKNINLIRTHNVEQIKKIQDLLSMIK